MDVKLYVDRYDEHLGSNGNETDYTVTSEPIIIKSVKINKH